MREKIRGNEYWVTLVYVDSYQDGVLRGHFTNPYLEAPQEFNSLADFLIMMECMLDTMRLPQSYAEPRTFRESTVRLRSEPVQFDRGEKATFALSVRFRQHSSWQGYITWLDKNRSQSFRSALEMIFLVDSALRENGSALQDGQISLA